MFGTMAGSTAERLRLDTDLSASAVTTLTRRDSNFPAAAKPTWPNVGTRHWTGNVSPIHGSTLHVAEPRRPRALSLGAMSRLL